MLENTPTETLVKVALTSGRYDGVLTAAEETGVEAVHQGQVIAAAKLGQPDADGTVTVQIDLPASVLSDGVHVVALRSTTTGAVLDRLSFLAGDVLDEDLRSEVALLRDELELLKRAFRRHVRASSP